MSDAAGSVLGSGAAIATGILEKNAAKKAYRKQREGLIQQKKLLKQDYDVDRINALINKYDRQYLLKRQELQKELDPELAQVRQLGKEQLLAQFQTPESARQSTRAARALFEENIRPDAAAERLKQKLFTQAETELGAGATLPPEFQAELVRSGLEQGGQAGIGLSRRTIGGNVSRLLGSGGVALQQSRQNQAMNLANAGQQLADARVNILSKVFPTVTAAENQSIARSASAFNLGNQNLPSGGLTGREGASYDIAGREGIREIGQRRADLSAQNTLTQARFLNNIIGTAASAGGALFQSQQVDPTTGQVIMPAGSGTATGGGGGGGGGGMDIGSLVGIAGMFSDRDIKTDVVPVDKSRRNEILDRVTKLPLAYWRYDMEGLDTAEHLGPMAQDFSAAFEVGASDRMIHPVDANGVLLASIQALADKVRELEVARKA